MSEGQTHQQSRARLVAGRYQLLRELGRGGMGTVWLADDQLIARRVAVKELRPPQGLPAERGVFARRALSEANSAARIHHPGAVTLFDVIPATAADDAVYLIMEYVEGPTLAQLIRSQGPLPDAVAAGYGLQLLDVLAAAHALGVVHRDVKPANIIITPAGQVKLTDFGIAHVLGDARLTRSGVMGTQAYMAPELFDSQPITPAADLWALGATLYAASHGHGAFDRDTTAATLRAILIDPIPAPRCSPALAAAITSLLQRDPARRATTDQARALLHQAATEGTSSAKPTAANISPADSASPATARGNAGTGHRQPAADAPTWEQAKTTRAPTSPAVTAPRKPRSTTKTSGKRPLRRRVVNAVISVAFLAAVFVVWALVSIHSGGPTLPKEVRAVLQGDASIGSVAFTSDGSTVVTSSDSTTAGQAWLWDTATGKQVASLPAGTNDTLAAVSPDGSTLAYGNSKDQVELWGTASRSVTRDMPFPGTDQSLFDVAITPDGHTLAAGGNGGQVYLYSLANDSLAATLTDPESASSVPAVNFVVFSPDGSLLAATDDLYGEIFVWNVASRRLIGTVAVPTDCNSCDAPDWIAFSPDSGTLAVADQQQGVRLWNVATRTWGATIPVGNVQGVIAFSLDGTTLASGTASGAITLWNLASDKPISTFQEPDGGEVTAIAFSPDGKTLATADVTGQAYLWNVTGD